MIILSYNGKRGAKRKRRRLEDLIKISIQALITNRPGARSSFTDHRGVTLDFVDELVGNEQLLTVYVNGERSDVSFPIVDDLIGGRIKNKVSCDRNRTYYVIVDGKRYRHLYIDPIKKEIGSRDSLNAVYTSQSVWGTKNQQFWRDWQRLKKKLHCG